MNKIQKAVVIMYCLALIASLIWFPDKIIQGETWKHSDQYTLDYAREALQILVMSIITGILLYAFKTKKVV